MITEYIINENINLFINNKGGFFKMGDHRRDPIDTAPDQCCTAETGCHFDGSLRNVVAEPIYTQKVYDATLFNLQGLRTIQNQPFSPRLDDDDRIVRVLDIRCRKFFNPEDIEDPRNLKVKKDTQVAGAQFVQKNGKDIEVVGPDGTHSEKLLYTDTSECDENDRGTPIFGTQTLYITGNVVVELDVIVENGCDDSCNDRCNDRCNETLVANVQIAPPEAPLVLTNFFELCMPSVFDGAFLPRFTEFCNISCEPRLATSNVNRDIRINPKSGQLTANLLITVSVTCEKKIVVPVQLCVLSTGFPKLSPDTSPITATFPTLFPKQIDEDSKKHRKNLSETENIIKDTE